MAHVLFWGAEVLPGPIDTGPIDSSGVQWCPLDPFILPGYNGALWPYVLQGEMVLVGTMQSFRVKWFSLDPFIQRHSGALCAIFSSRV